MGDERVKSLWSQTRAAALVQGVDGQALRRSHERAWAHLWQRCDMRVRTRRGDARADPAIQVLLRMHVFHILQTVSRNSVDLDVGIPARGLGGEVYHGHVFWDDLFVFPFLNLHLPELGRALLQYRYRRLPQARRLAAQAGYQGAMFPWRSGVEGTEETPALQRNPRTARPHRSAAAYRCGHRLQRLALLPGHRRPGAPVALWGRADPRGGRGRGPGGRAAGRCARGLGAGGLSVAVLEGRGLVEAARVAVACADVAVTRYGSQAAYPTRAELAHLLE